MFIDFLLEALPTIESFILGRCLAAGVLLRSCQNMWIRTFDKSSAFLTSMAIPGKSISIPLCPENTPVPLSFRPIWVNVLTEASRLSSSIPKPCSGRPVEIVSEYLVVLEYLEGRENCILSRGLLIDNPTGILRWPCHPMWAIPKFSCRRSWRR